MNIQSKQLMSCILCVLIFQCHTNAHATWSPWQFLNTRLVHKIAQFVHGPVTNFVLSRSGKTTLALTGIGIACIAGIYAIHRVARHVSNLREQNRLQQEQITAQTNLQQQNQLQLTNVAGLLATEQREHRETRAAAQATDLENNTAKEALTQQLIAQETRIQDLTRSFEQTRQNIKALPAIKTQLNCMKETLNQLRDLIHEKQATINALFTQIRRNSANLTDSWGPNNMTASEIQHMKTSEQTAQVLGHIPRPISKEPRTTEQETVTIINADAKALRDLPKNDLNLLQRKAHGMTDSDFMASSLFVNDKSLSDSWITNGKL